MVGDCFTSWRFGCLLQSGSDEKCMTGNGGQNSTAGEQRQDRAKSRRSITAFCPVLLITACQFIRHSLLVLPYSPTLVIDPSRAPASV